MYENSLVTKHFLAGRDLGMNDVDSGRDIVSLRTERENERIWLRAFDVDFDEIEFRIEWNSWPFERFRISWNGSSIMCSSAFRTVFTSKITDSSFWIVF